MTALYNEWDPYPAAWMRNLIAAGHLAPGRVDERSIAELVPTDLVGVVQFHAFAGLGGWGCALRRAGWADDREVWTLSCPCQGLSVAGLQRGADDGRHLWPVIYRLIAECLPPVLFGEQVAGAAGIAWLTAVRADLEDLGYAVGAADLAAASVGAPHIRQRMFFGAVRLSDAEEFGRGPGRDDRSCGQGEIEPRRHGAGDAGGLGDADREPSGRDGGSVPRAQGTGPNLRGRDHGPRPASADVGRPPVGPWDDAIWLDCRDGNRRPSPAQPGLHPLAHGVPGRVGQLRAAGNAIVVEAAAEFIRAFDEALTDTARAA